MLYQQIESDSIYKSFGMIELNFQVLKNAIKLNLRYCVSEKKFAFSINKLLCTSFV